MNALGIILLIACILNGYLAAVSFRYRKTPGAITFGLFQIAISLYCLGYAFEIHSTTLSEILFWLKIEYLGIPFFPTLLIIFSFQFAGKEYWLKPWFIRALIAFSLTTLVIHYTNNSTHWFYATTSLDTTGPLALIKSTKGLWYWIHQAFCVLSMGTFNLVFFVMYLRDLQKRKQALLMLLSSIAPWIGYIVYETGNSPYGIDLTPFSFVIMGVVTAWGMIKYKLFDFAPLALENVFEYMNDAVIITDQKNRIANYNKAAHAAFENISPKSIGRPVQTLQGVCPVITELIKCQDSQQKDIKTNTLINKKYYEARVSIIYNKDNQSIGKTITFQDITERKQTEQLLISNQNRLWKLNETKDKLLSIIGHDLRAPLGNIQNLADLLNDSFVDLKDEEKKQIAKTLQNSAMISLRFLDNLLVWAKSQTGGIQYNPQAYKLNSIIKETLDVLKPLSVEKHITLELKVPDQISVFADAQMISLVIRNLVSNAIKFTHREGKIILSATSTKKETMVKVEDNGIGIPEDNLKNLFNLNRSIRRNGTDNETGTGLGLLLCKEFIDQHQGKIGVEKSSGKGTVFFFTVPVIQ